MSIIAFRAFASFKAFEICESLSFDTMLIAFDLDTPRATILLTRSSTLLFGINEPRTHHILKRARVMFYIKYTGLKSSMRKAPNSTINVIRAALVVSFSNIVDSLLYVALPLVYNSLARAE